MTPAPVGARSGVARLASVELDDRALGSASTELDQERRVAVFDLLEENSFDLPDGPGGPYHLRLGLERRKVNFDVATVEGRAACRFSLSLGPLDQAVKDYGTLCETYVEAVKSLPPAQIETIDQARRNIHAASAEILRERLAKQVLVDGQTARRLFTLICVLASDAGPAIMP